MLASVFQHVYCPILLQPQINEPAEVADDSQLSMMERRPWKLRDNRQLPLRFRDELPQPPPPAPLASHTDSNMSLSDPVFQGSSSDQVSCPSLSKIRNIFTTPRNIFGLFRRYNTTEIPSHDPDEHVVLEDLSNIQVDMVALDSNSFYPFPNRSAFSLGEWHWNRGVQKSQGNFRELTDILCDPDFRVEDIRDVNWNLINKKLGTDDKDAEWLDEDAGWTRTPVTISVPYQSRRGTPSKAGAGPQNFVVEDFYHRSLVSVIREKISGLGDPHHFHFEPYELLWQTKNMPSPVRVQGELYTSPSFIEAHRQLQDSPMEPGCDLPRVIVALMFWSDATQLTAFGNTKLWPLYMFFGNESKYGRCRPSSHLCEHVAYFQSVRPPTCQKLYSSILLNLTAAREFQSLCQHTNCRGESTNITVHDLLPARILPRAMEDSFR
jgi:hypothetical protein